MIREKPIFGQGPNMILRVYPDYRWSGAPNPKQPHLHAGGIAAKAGCEELQRVGISAHFQQRLDSEQPPFFAILLFRNGLFAIAITFLVLTVDELLACISDIDRPQ